VTTVPPRDLVKATALADEVAFRIQASILDGEYALGRHLQQEELCERFGVSRTPVREALRKLQAQHLIDLVPTRSELSEVYVLRSELEGFAAELAAANIGPDALEALDRAQLASDRALNALAEVPMTVEQEALFNAQITQANEAFHGVIHEAAGNVLLKQYVLDLQNFFPKDYVWRAVSAAHEARTMNIDEHEAIRLALSQHDGAAARLAMSSHIQHAGSLLFAYLDEHLSWA
jgi:DNA-binding GntR family transcriptional regulator